MSSKLIRDNVKLAFNILSGMDITQTITFIVAADRVYDFASGEVNETETSYSFKGVVEQIADSAESGTVLEDPKVKIIINKSDLDVDYTLLDKFEVNGKTFRITDYVDNFYALEITGDPL